MAGANLGNPSSHWETAGHTDHFLSSSIGPHRETSVHTHDQFRLSIYIYMHVCGYICVCLLYVSVYIYYGITN